MNYFDTKCYGDPLTVTIFFSLCLMWQEMDHIWVLDCCRREQAILNSLPVFYLQDFRVNVLYGFIQTCRDIYIKGYSGELKMLE